LVRLIKSNYLIPWSKDYGMHYFLQFLIGFKNDRLLQFCDHLVELASFS
jgi:hypothetical protein